MSGSVYYHQGCPVCGRVLRIGVKLLGERVFCQHCGGGFRASDATLEADGVVAVEQSQSDRIELLLQQVAASLGEACGRSDAACCESEGLLRLAGD